MSPAVTCPGPCFFNTMRLGPSPCILSAMSLMLSTMSVTSSRTPAIEENSCRTPSMCTEVTAAPCSDESKMRLSALPSVRPKPRSRGSATTVATRLGSPPTATASFSGRISSCQFFGFTSVFISHPSRSGTVLFPRPRPSRRENESPAPNYWAVLENSDAPAFARSATVMRNRRHVADRCDGEARCLQRAQRRLAARARTRHIDLERAHAVFLRLARGVFGRDLRRIGRRLARALEAERTRRRPGDGVALRVGDRDCGVVEARVHVRHARDDVLALAAADTTFALLRGCRGCFLAHHCPLRAAGRSALWRYLFAGDRASLALARARIGVGALTPYRQIFAMTET